MDGLTSLTLDYTAPDGLTPLYGSTPEVNYTNDGGVLGTSTTNTTDYTAPVGDPSLVAYWNNQASLLNGQLGQLDPTQAVGMGNLQNSYNTQRQDLSDQYSVAQRDYGIGKADTEAGYGSARNAGATRARNQLGALQRLLGINGAGVSSASQDAVPLAVAQGATQDFAPLQTTYGQNRRNQDLALDDTTRDFNKGNKSLDQGLFGQQNSLKSSIAQTRADLLSQIQNAGVQSAIAGGQTYEQAQAANASYDPQIQGLLSLITQLGSQYQTNVAPSVSTKYDAPNLMQYLLGQQSQVNQTNPGGDSVNPLFVPLLGKDDEEQLG